MCGGGPEKRFSGIQRHRLAKGKNTQTQTVNKRKHHEIKPIYLRIRHFVYAGVQIVWRSMDWELVQRNVSVIKVDVRNAPFIRRRPMSHTCVQYLFCLHSNNTADLLDISQLTAFSKCITFTVQMKRHNLHIHRCETTAIS